MKVTISLGGSIMVPDEPDINYIKKVANLLSELCNDHEIAVVAGGGKLAREYIEITRGLGSSEEFSDNVGIAATRMNAYLLISAIGSKANQKPALDIQTAAKQMGKGKIAVMGGTDPGHSTDAVAAELAEITKADLFIKATDVDAIYDKDPQEHKDAKRLDEISIDQLTPLVESQSSKAGTYALIDMRAVQALKRSKVKGAFLSGRDFDNLKRAIEGKDFKGTSID